MRFRIIFAAVIALVALASRAAEPVLDTSLREEIVFIKNGSGLFAGELETTFFRPAGDGPFPLVVINHGKAAGNTHFQARARYNVAAREFVRRGYMVMIPMRGGFSRSSGNYVDGGCYIEGNALNQARDVRAALDYALTLPAVDRQRILLIGQSHGGLTTLAFGSEPYPGVRGLVNFAGGLRLTECPGWQGSLVRAFAAFGARSQFPSLWFYGDNDSYWPRQTIADMYSAYVGAGGKARMVAFGTFKGDAHGLFGQRDGLAIWWPEVEKFLSEIGLPTQILPGLAESDPATEALKEAARKLALGEHCRQVFQSFLDADYPRAFAVAGSRCGYAAGGTDARQRAIGFCRGKTEAACRIVAVDNVTVEAEGSTP